MSTVQPKAFLKSYKRRIQKKVDDVVHEAENACMVIQQIASKFKERTECLLDEEDEVFFAEYSKLQEELEVFSEKIFLALNIVSSSADDSAVATEDKNEHYDTELPVCADVQSVSKDLPSTSESQKITCVSNDLPSTDSGIFLKLHSDGSGELEKEKSHLANSKALSTVPSLVNDDDSLTVVKHGDVTCLNNNHVSVPENCETSSLSSSVQSEVYAAHNSVSGHSQSNQFSNCRDSSTAYNEEVPYKYASEDISSKLSSSTGSFISAHSTVPLPRDDLTLVTEVIERDIPVQDVPIGSVIMAVITYFQSPSDFWMQLENPAIEECLMSSQYIRIEPSTVRQLKYCLAPFRRTGFYQRAQILCFFGNGNNIRVQVFYLDCGNVAIIYAAELMLLPDSLYEYPAQAIHCCLSGIAPIGNVWSIEALEKFEELVQYSDLHATVLFKQDEKFAVQLNMILKMPDETETCDLAQMLCLMGFAVPMKVETSSPAHRNDFSVNMTPSSVSSSECGYVNFSCENVDSFLNPDKSKTSLETVSTNSSSALSQTAYEQSLLCEPRACAKVRLTAARQEAVGDSEKCLYFPESELCHFANEKSDLPLGSLESHSESLLGSDENDIYLSDESECENRLSSHISENISESQNTALPNCCLSSTAADCVNDLDGNEVESESCECLYLDVVVPPPQPLFIQEDLMIVIPSVIYSPSYFYANASTGNPLELDELRDQMTNFYEQFEYSSSYSIDIKDIKENMFFAYPYEDKFWYRVQISYICDAKDSCDMPRVVVLYIDYGNESTVSVKDLRPLMPQFAKYPAMAIPCSLAYIAPKSNNADYCNSKTPCFNLKWDKRATDRFLEITCDEKPLTAQVSEFQKLDESRLLYEVFLWETGAYGDRIINDMLVEEGLANYCNINVIPNLLRWNTSQDDELSGILSIWDPMSEDFNSVTNSYGVDVSDVEVATVGYRATDEKYVCKFYANNRKCYRGENCPYQHIAAGCGSETADQDGVYVYENSVNLPEPGTWCLVQVSSVMSPGHFFIVFPFGTSSVHDIQSNTDLSLAQKNEFEQLSSAMSEYYSNAPLDDNTAVALAYGSIVVARTSFDGNWYRARIIEVQDIARPLEVFYLDFGTTEWVERKNIRQIQPEFLHCPFQAVEAFLANVDPINKENGGKWTSKARSTFEKLVRKKMLLAYINQRIGSVLFVTLKLTAKRNKIVINNVLVEEKHAQFSTSTSRMCLTESKYSNHARNSKNLAKCAVKEPG